MTLLVSPFLRTLQTASYLQSALSPEKTLPLIVNDYLSANMSEGDLFEPLIHGALAVCPKSELIEKLLDGKVREIARDHLTKLEKLKAPDKDFSKRYIKGLEDIFSNWA